MTGWKWFIVMKENRTKYHYNMQHSLWVCTLMGDSDNSAVVLLSEDERYKNECLVLVDLYFRQVF